MRCLRFVTETKVAPNFWTHPKAVGELLLTMFSIRRCPHCHTIIWLGDSEPLGQTYAYFSGVSYLSVAYIQTVQTHYALDRMWANAPIVESVDVSNCFDAATMPVSRVGIAALGTKVATLRGYIDSQIRGIPVSDANLRDSMMALLSLLDESDPPQRLIKAEGLRELGHFDKALHLLAGMAGQWRFAADQIANLTTQGSRRVKRVAGRDDGPFEPEGRLRMREAWAVRGGGQHQRSGASSRFTGQQC